MITMKKFYIAVMAVFALAATSCEHIDLSEIENEDTTEQVRKTKAFTFTVKGDFENPTFTRAYLATEETGLKDLWVLDYVDGELVQQVHQVPADEDWGKPKLQLEYGSHHVYFVASQGDEPVLDTEDGSIKWSVVRDTYWKDYEVTVVNTSNGNRAVTLDRVITKFTAKIDDELKTGTAKVVITPARWYFGLDYTTGVPCQMKENTAREVAIPAENIGVAGASISMYGISAASEWTTDVKVEAKKADGTVLGAVSIKNAPFVRNRATEYHGNLYGAGGEMNVGVNDGWNTPFSSEW